jgi:sugar phosphate isomerase/epimerase
VKSLCLLYGLPALLLLAGCTAGRGRQTGELFARENLVAWCIVPFDAAQRSPEQRADMLKELGITRLAYDYRDEHIPSFEHELEVLKERGIVLQAVWLWLDPKEGEILNASNRTILEILEESGTHTELWVSFPAQVFGEKGQEERVDKAVRILEAVSERAGEIGCTIALYNHGDWFGEPENQLEILSRLDPEKVRIVYNFHHGHTQVERFPELLDRMLPYLSCININGMRVDGPKILPVGAGDREEEMLRAIAASGYSGPIGILGHTEGRDIRPVLESNLEGLEKIAAGL